MTIEPGGEERLETEQLPHRCQACEMFLNRPQNHLEINGLEPLEPITDVVRRTAAIVDLVNEFGESPASRWLASINDEIKVKFAASNFMRYVEMNFCDTCRHACVEVLACAPADDVGKTEGDSQPAEG